MDQPLLPITAITNMSMDELMTMLCLKRATIASLIKRSRLAKVEMKNDRPIFNLPFISKPIEKVVASRV